jgi:lysophospholipase L1-like esterase
MSRRRAAIDPGGLIMRATWPILACLSVLSVSPAQAGSADRYPLEGVRRIVFLGDSITYVGDYINFTEALLRLSRPELKCEFLNLGLPSETVSGLSEPGHAGGQFPRPDLHERLDRVLQQTRPDLIVACYGMNDGIYSPFGDARFERFKEGMRSLRERAGRAGARVVYLTPTVFDPLPIKDHTLPAGHAEYRLPFEGYDDVLERYSDWLIGRKAEGWDVVDIHGPLKRFLVQQRARDPDFRLADDGIHLNSLWHWLIARELLRHWRVPAAELAGASGDEVLARLPHGPEVFKLVAQRQAALKDAWLSATGHKRPGMKQGLPLAEARKQAQEIEARIQGLTEVLP